jgi:hypothetical protein
VPSQLLQFRPDIRKAERELEAAGLDVKVTRARFFPQLSISGPVGYQAFNPKYLLWTPDAWLVNLAGDLVVPVINRKAIQADYLTANARQLQTIYNYQRVILNAFTEVYNRMAKVENYRKSIEIKKQQVESLVASVESATKLFQAARVEYMDVLFAQRDLWEARLILIDTKVAQLGAIVNVYQALGGGLLGCGCVDPRLPQPGPNLAQSQQGGSDQSGPERIPAPREQSEQVPAPREVPGSDKLPELLPEPDNVIKPSKLPERPPEPGKLPPSVFAPVSRSD